jgi:hypothetical protein
VWFVLQEDAHKVDRQAEEEEKKKMAEAYWMFDGHPRKFREIVSRRKKKKGETHHLPPLLSAQAMGSTCITICAAYLLVCLGCTVVPFF